MSTRFVVVKLKENETRGTYVNFDSFLKVHARFWIFIPMYAQTLALRFGNQYLIHSCVACFSLPIITYLFKRRGLMVIDLLDLEIKSSI